MARNTVLSLNDFLLDKSTPTTSMNKLHNKITRGLDDLDRRLSEVIKRYSLNQPEETLLVGYNPLALGEIVVPVQTLFARCDTMLRVYEVQLKWAANELDLSVVAGEVKEKHRELLQTCQEMRVVYIDTIGARVLRAFRRELLVKRHAQAGDTQPGYSLNKILVHYFGDAMMDPHNFNEPPAQELLSLLSDIGKLTGNPTAADTLIKAIEHIND